MNHQLENRRVKLSLLDLSNYEHLLEISQQDDLIYYSPSDISSPEKLRDYVSLAVDGYYHKTIIPYLIFDKGIQVIILRSTNRVAVTESVQLLGIDEVCIDPSFQRRVGHRRRTQ